MYEINMQSKIPIYDQILKMLVSQILSGIIKPDEQLPSVRQLAKDIGVNPNTVSKTYKELEREEIIYSVPGKGSFVSKTNKKKLEKYLLDDFDKSVKQALKIGFDKDDLKSRIDELTDES
jgi:GntR family transcriptional regulator